jgi:predicted RNase H-related nuclease YkuK (DUF458 family)
MLFENHRYLVTVVNNELYEEIKKFKKSQYEYELGLGMDSAARRLIEIGLEVWKSKNKEEK